MTPKRNHKPEENTDSWLMSYADMITLLMCFFIIFVSMSVPKSDQMQAITQELARHFGGVDMSTPFAGMYEELGTIAEKHHLLRDLAMTKKENGVELEMATYSFFNNDSAELNDEHTPALLDIVKALNKISFMDYRIAVEAHTNDIPVKSGLYPTNWELSSAQASRLVRFFIDQGVTPEHLKAVGYADSMPKVPNRDANGNAIVANRQINQRIVIKIERKL